MLSNNSIYTSELRNVIANFTKLTPPFHTDRFQRNENTINTGSDLAENKSALIKISFIKTICNPIFFVNYQIIM